MIKSIFILSIIIHGSIMQISVTVVNMPENCSLAVICWENCFGLAEFQTLTYEGKIFSKIQEEKSQCE